MEPTADSSGVIGDRGSIRGRATDRRRLGVLCSMVRRYRLPAKARGVVGKGSGIRARKNEKASAPYQSPTTRQDDRVSDACHAPEAQRRPGGWDRRYQSQHPLTVDSMQIRL